jgi:hypothetical protein
VAVIGVVSGEFSGTAHGLGLFIDHWFDSALECCWGNLSACRRCGALDPRREGWGPSSELETKSWSPLVLLEAIQAVLPLMMLPTIPAPPGVGILKTMASASQAELSFLFLLFACFIVCMLCKHSVPAGCGIIKLMQGFDLPFKNKCVLVLTPQLASSVCFTQIVHFL